MWFLARTANSRTIILDEPDVYMHADLQRRLIRLLKLDESRQIIIATHSAEIMAEVEADEVLLVDRKRRASSFAGSMPTVQKILEHVGGVHNLAFARLANSKVLLLVEGNDVPFLKRFQDKIFPQSRRPIDTIPHIPLGGWSGWQYALGVAKFLRSASDHRVAPICILDRDFHTSEEIDTRLKQAKEANIELTIWNRKEIENYLLVPEAIARVLCRRSKRVKGVDAAEIEKALDEIAEGMKDDVLDRFIESFHAIDKASGPAMASKRAREYARENWNGSGRLRLVGGKEVISALSAWAQNRYSVSLSPLAIAAELRREEIDEAVVSLISRIEQLN